jgi:FSR family fosmidomycin resistance protein-like MFS transporter
MSQPTPADMEEERESRRLSIRILALVSGGHALSNFYVLCLPALIPFLKTDFNVSYTLLGLILTVRAITTGVLQVPVGFLVDRLGGKKVLIVGLFMLSVSFGLLAFIPNFYWSLPLMVVFGIGLATMRPCNYTILNASIHPSWVGRAFGINMSAAHTGRVIAPPLIVTTAVIWDWRIAVLVAAGMGLLVTLLITSQWRIVRDDTIQPKRTTEIGFLQELRLLASGSLFMFFIFFVFNSLTTHGVHSFTVAALAELRATPLTVASGALTGYLVASAIGVFAGGFIVDKTPRHVAVAVLVLLGSGLLFIVVGAVNMTIFWIITLMSLAGALQGVLRPARDMLMRAIIPQASFGKAIGMVATGAAIGGAVAPVVFGWVLDAGNPSWVFYMLAACVAILVATVAWPKRAISLP